MDFTVMHEGSSYMRHEDICSAFEQSSQNPTWALANQSIYADLLEACQSHYIKPDLCISMVSAKSSFVVDLDLDTLRTESVFELTTCVQRSQPEPERAQRVEKLLLGSLRGRVEVDLRNKAVCMSIGEPSLAFVFDNDLRLEDPHTQTQKFMDIHTYIGTVLYYGLRGMLGTDPGILQWFILT
jgi:hypothetical protein